MNKIKFCKFSMDGKRRMWASDDAMVLVHEWKENELFSVTRYLDGDTITHEEKFTSENEALQYAEEIAL